MKPLIPALLLIPFLSFGQQKFEVSEQAGVGGNLNHKAGQYVFSQFGLSNQVALTYMVSKHFSASALYEYERLQHNHSFGLSADVRSRHLFAGVDIKEVNLSQVKFQDYISTTTFSYQPSLGVGLHVGATQKIVGRLRLIEQAGYNYISLRGNRDFENPYGAQLNLTGRSISSSEYYPYIRAGLSYRL